MSARGHAKTTVRRAVWLGALGIVLAGLFGMHGLDSHGAPGMQAAHAVMAGPQEAVSGGHEAMLSPAAPDEGSTTTANPVAGSGHPTMDVGMEVTCMAILAMGLLALLRTLRGRGARRVLSMLSRPVRAPAFMGRDPDPPSLIALSIQRC